MQTECKISTVWRTLTCLDNKQWMLCFILQYWYLPAWRWSITSDLIRCSVQLSLTFVMWILISVVVWAVDFLNSDCQLLQEQSLEKYPYLPQANINVFVMNDLFLCLTLSKKTPTPEERLLTLLGPEGVIVTDDDLESTAKNYWTSIFYFHQGEM